jgi:eukaryotic-like serine/threonine-protein kinase
VGSSASEPGTVHGEFAATVQTMPPADVPGLYALDSPPAADSLPATDSQPGADSDIGLDITAESANVAEQPTLSHIGRYALKSLLGEGGLGRVYEAWDPLLSRTVAVKTLQFNLDMPSRISLDRLLLNEARAAGSLTHAHIVTVHDAGLSAHGVYIAMERLRGRDLRQAIAEGWRPSASAAAQIIRRVADALAYAHARGVVHCDIKPGNIFLTRKDKPKVLDFGIARAANASALPAGEPLVAGSPHYLAPEQLQGGVVDARTDIYALGVVLYEVLTGRKAFTGESLEQIHAAVLHGTPPPVRELRPDVPQALSDIVARAMARDPQVRPASASELSQSLRHFAQAAPAADGAEPADRPAHKPTRWLAGAALVAAAVVSLGWTLRPPAAPDAPAAAASPPTPAGAGAPAVVATLVATAPVAAAAAPPSPTPAQDRQDGAAAPGPDASQTAPAAAVPQPAKPVRAPTPRQKPAPAVEPKAPVVLATGVVQIAVSPWGQVEVNGSAAGTTPPLTKLTLPEGSHTITVRNADFAPYTTTVQVSSGKPAIVRYRFGS